MTYMYENSDLAQLYIITHQNGTEPSSPRLTEANLEEQHMLLQVDILHAMFKLLVVRCEPSKFSKEFSLQRSTEVKSRHM